MDIDKLIKNLQFLQSSLPSMGSNVLRDASGVNSAISDLYRQKKSRSKSIRIDVPNLVFNVPKKTHQHLQPRKAEFKHVKLNMSLTFEGKELSIDSISEMSVDIVLIGMDCGKDVHNAWHFDFHSTLGDETFAHPMFHCQNGGRNLRTSPNDSSNPIETGEIFLVESPRIAHPPLDPVLAIDFVVGHFLGNSDLNKLHNTREFRHALQTSMKAVWKPYYQTMVNFFDVPTDETNKTLAQKLNPSLSAAT